MAAGQVFKTALLDDPHRSSSHIAAGSSLLHPIPPSLWQCASLGPPPHQPSQLLFTVPVQAQDSLTRPHSCSTCAGSHAPTWTAPCCCLPARPPSQQQLLAAIQAPTAAPHGQRHSGSSLLQSSSRMAALQSSCVSRIPPSRHSGNSQGAVPEQGWARAGGEGAGVRITACMSGLNREDAHPRRCPSGQHKRRRMRLTGDAAHTQEQSRSLACGQPVLRLLVIPVGASTASCASASAKATHPGPLDSVPAAPLAGPLLLLMLLRTLLGFPLLFHTKLLLRPRRTQARTRSHCCSHTGCRNPTMQSGLL